MLEYDVPSPPPSLPPEPPKIPPFGSFCQNLHFSKSIFLLGGNYDVNKTPQTLLHPSFVEKELIANAQKYFLNQKHQKEAILWGLRRKEAMKEEEMDPHTSVPETRTNLCQYAKRILRIGSKVLK